MLVSLPLLSLLAALSGVLAQNVPPCVLNCTTQALANQTSSSQPRCTSVTNLTCICTNMPLQNDIGTCLKAHCSAADQQAGLALQQQECSNVTGSTANATSSKSASVVSSSATAASSHNAAPASKLPFSASGPVAVQLGLGALGVAAGVAVLF